jgi:predicted RNA-binding protein YlxR (DUF448 family)
MPQRPRHVPQRSCVACRGSRAKRELTRLVLDANGHLRIDARGQAPGRGAYLCDNTACWERAAASDVLAGALRTTLRDEDRARLRAWPSPAEAGTDQSARYASAGKTNI